MVPLFAAAPAFAASQNDYDDCMQHVDPDHTIAGCTHVIEDASVRSRTITWR
jgi:hypothetical protein